MYSIIQNQILKSSVENVWDFMSSPLNLNTITPPDMKFFIKNQEHIDRMYPGQIICYKVSPYPGIKLDWVTEITHVADQDFFVDEQRFGPYKFWHHQHKIKETNDGVLMSDIVHYELPFGPFGTAVHSLFIRKKLEHIFKYRREQLENIFNK
ncbi:MAG: SRPBCC family protein [Bacteroidia bacterium]